MPRHWLKVTDLPRLVLLPVAPGGQESLLELHDLESTPNPEYSKNVGFKSDANPIIIIIIRLADSNS
jgi:hypothetical protein